MASLRGGFWSFLTVILAVAVAYSSATEFQVGGDFGWQQPGPSDTDVYSQWATNNRFHIGDSLSFKYENDSVVEVDKWGYYHCNISNPMIPILAFHKGNSSMKLDRSGPFYFISGVPDHCKNGQRLLVHVMHPISETPPSIANPPEPYMATESPAPLPSSLGYGDSGVAILAAPCSIVIALIVTALALVFPAP